jgi:hypothetical protein
MTVPEYMNSPIKIYEISGQKILKIIAQLLLKIYLPRYFLTSHPGLNPGDEIA